MKLLLKMVSTLLIITILLTIVPLTVFADDEYTVTIDPFEYDSTYGDFARYFDITAEVNGQPAEIEGSSFHFDDFTDVITIRASLKEEWHNFPCHVTGITLTYDTDDGTVPQDLELEIINQYRDVETTFSHDGDVHISFTVDKVYKVLIEESDDGVITADRYRAKEGDRVQLSITPTNPDKPDYLLYVTDDRGYDVEVADDLSFIMPGGSSDVTVEVQFYKKPDHVCSYIDRRWDSETEQVISEERYLTQADGVIDMSTVADGATLQAGKWYYLSQSRTFSNRIKLPDQGEVNLVLGDGATLTCDRGIDIPYYARLNIYGQTNGTGKISAVYKGKQYEVNEACIGGQPGSYGGCLAVYGGVINANNNYRTEGAPIGGGNGYTIRRIEIYGGDITAKDTVGYSAGIGGGKNGETPLEGIYIYGGNIDSFGFGGAGIGSGREPTGTDGDIRIYGGTVKATGHGLCAGIGGGTKGKNGRIYIFGGTVNALAKGSAHCGAGIGSGAQASGTGDIYISGGNIVSRSRQGAGIGSGSETPGGKIFIAGGNVGGTSTEGGAGIGAGKSASNGTVSISGGLTVGSSSLYDETDEVMNRMLDLYSYNDNYSDEVNMGGSIIIGISWLIESLSDTEYAGAGIGGGHGGSGGTVDITGGTVVALTGTHAAQAIGKGKNGGTSGNLDLYTTAKVTAGDSESDAKVQTPSNRISACRSSKYALIEPCAHKDATYSCYDESDHIIHCDYCGVSTLKYAHTFEENELVCDKCGYERVKVSFDPGDGSGEMADVYVKKGGDYTLPDSSFTPPSGKVFFSWNAIISGTNETYPVGSVLKPDDSVILTARYTDPYKLWVGGVQVTNANHSDILGDGKVTYDPESCTLHFDNYSGDMPGVHNNTLIYSDGINLTITGCAVLNRTAGFANGMNIRSGSLTLDGDFTLTKAQVNAVFADKDIILKSGTIEIKGNNYGIRANRTMYIRKEITRVTSDASTYYSLYYTNLDMDPSLVAIEISAESRALTYDRAKHIVIAPGAVVRFKLNGGKYNGYTDDILKTIQKNTTVEKPDPDPTRTGGYAFGGWYSDEALTQAFDFAQAISEDITLYAKWTRSFSVDMKWKKASNDEHIPDEVKVVLQHYNGSEWTTVETVTLNAANNWKATFAPVKYQSSEDHNKYRIREMNKDDVVILDKDDDYGSDVPSSIFNVDGNETGYLVSYNQNGMIMTITNSSCKVYSVEKKWDADIETASGKQDRPDELQVVLQKRDNWFSWKTVEILTLKRDNDWSGEFQPVAAGYVNSVGTFVEYKYRVRELEAEEEDENGQPPQYNTEEERLNAADDRVVYDKWDLDKPFWKNVISTFKDPDTWIHFEPEMDQVKDWAKDVLIPSPTVEFKVKEYTDFYGVNVEEHTTKYNVKYEHDSSTHKMKITNLAVVDAKVHSWWINFQEYTDEETGETKSEKPESCYVMLESKIKKDYRDKIGEAGEYADIYTPCFSTVAGGYSLDKLPGVSDLKDGVKTGIKKLMGDGFIGEIGSAALDEFVLKKISGYLQTGVAIAKQDGKAENPLNRWYTTFTVKKYGMGEFKLPMDYAAVELVTGLIELVLDAAIKYFGIQNVHVPVMYQPIDRYWSIKGYEIDLGDTMFLCNIINIKFHGDDDNLGSVVGGMKYWKGDKEEDRPDSIKIHVYYEDDSGDKQEVTGSPVTVQKPEDGGDSWPWSLEIPLGDNASHVDKDSFIIEEESVSGYDSSVSGYDITNTKNSDPTEPTQPSTDTPTESSDVTEPTESEDGAGKLKITATRSSSDASKEQSFVYNVSGPSDTTLTVAIVLQAGETSGSVTIAQLPAGEYIVTEETAWSWRYSDGGSKSATVGDALAKVSFDHSLENKAWLNGYSHRLFD